MRYNRRWIWETIHWDLGNWNHQRWRNMVEFWIHQWVYNQHYRFDSFPILFINQMGCCFCDVRMDLMNSGTRVMDIGIWGGVVVNLGIPWCFFLPLHCLVIVISNLLSLNSAAFLFRRLLRIISIVAANKVRVLDFHIAGWCQSYRREEFTNDNPS